MIVTVEELKAQARVDRNNEDTLIEAKIAAAQDHIERLLGFKIEETYGGEDQAPVPPALIEAVSQLAAWLFDQREPAIIGSIVNEVPFGVEEIVREYREWSW